MLKMVWFFHLFFLCFLGLTGAGQESIEFLNLYDTSSSQVVQHQHQALPVAVSVSVEHLNEISSSVLMAETWLRSLVLSHYPANKITTIVVGNDDLLLHCQKHNLGLILPSLKNIHHSLTRWGLDREIKVSPVFSSSCFHSDSALLRDNEMSEKFIKPLFQFLNTINSTYSINPPPFSSDKTKALTFMSSHLESMKKLGFLQNRVNVLLTHKTPKEKSKLLNRKLSDSDSKIINPYPARPTPLPEISPLHSSIGYSVPATVTSPQSSISSPPSPPFTFPSAAPPPFPYPSDSPPPMSFYSMSPELSPASPPPFGYLPPCNPVDNSHNTLPPSPSPSPSSSSSTPSLQALWCVAKPSVPSEKLQEAMDYACGEGGADCEEISPPYGSCFYPDTLVAHASYAFNNYWQKTKRNGGTCSFGGTAMLINADPSYVHCRFVLS
ncbi:hypothetical protein LWI29_012613 [Acer saccharum]|uniref:glucan endo-1,3-beta-D-glucosidase n=1 Tax=Acer saccharum TaxID=4024 RepID=A0AA39TF99_ACESA|nr:hypothetical protein LWI29_012613 [Acer saccharum]